ncbi:hypothetical protein D3C71_1410990 [compost metagenome]
MFFPGHELLQHPAQSEVHQAEQEGERALVVAEPAVDEQYVHCDAANQRIDAEQREIPPRQFGPMLERIGECNRQVHGERDSRIQHASEIMV